MWIMKSQKRKENSRGVNLSDDGYNPVNVPQSSWDIMRKFGKGCFQLTYKSRFSLFWDVTRRILVVRHRRFGTTYRSHRLSTAWPLTSQAITMEAWNHDFRIDWNAFLLEPLNICLPVCLSVCLSSTLRCLLLNSLRKVTKSEQNIHRWEKKILSFRCSELLELSKSTR
jgi:hypothetical protein